MKKIPEKFPDELLATGVFLSLTLLAVFHQLEFALDNQYLGGKDWFLHYFIAMQIHAQHFDWLQILDFYKTIGHGIGHYPPLTYLLSSLFLLSEQWDTLAALYASKTLFLVVLAGSLYLAGWKLGKSPWTGLIAASIGCLNPVVLQQAHNIILDFPTAAMVALALCAYAFTDNFEKKLPALFLGFFCGLGMLVKPNVLFFLAPFLLTAFLLPEKVKKIFSANRLYSVLLFFVSATLVTSLYYLPQITTLWSEGVKQTTLHTTDYHSNVMFYAREAQNVFLPYWIVLPVGALLGYALLRKQRWVWTYIITFLVSFCCYLFLNDAYHQYLYPYQVLLALASAHGLSLIPRLPKRIAGALFVVLVSFPIISPEPAFNLNRDQNWLDTKAMHHLFTERYSQSEHEKILVGSFGHERATDLVTVLAVEWKKKEKITAFLEEGSTHYNSVQIFPRNRSIGMNEFIRSAVDAELMVLVRPRGPIPDPGGEEYWNRLMAILNDPAGKHRVDFVYESHPDDPNGCRVYFFTKAF